MSTVLIVGSLTQSIPALTASLSVINSTPSTFESCFVSYLTTAVPSIGFHSGRTPQKTAYPCCVITTVDADQVVDLVRPTTLESRHVQLTTYSASAADAASASLSVQSALNGFSGMMGAMTVKNCVRHSQQSGYDANVDGSDSGTYFLMSEYFIYFQL